LLLNRIFLEVELLKGCFMSNFLTRFGQVAPSGFARSGVYYGGRVIRQADASRARPDLLVSTGTYGSVYEFMKRLNISDTHLSKEKTRGILLPLQSTLDGQEYLRRATRGWGQNVTMPGFDGNFFEPHWSDHLGSPSQAKIAAYTHVSAQQLVLNLFAYLNGIENATAIGAASASEMGDGVGVLYSSLASRSNPLIYSHADPTMGTIHLQHDTVQVIGKMFGFYCDRRSGEKDQNRVQIQALTDFVGPGMGVAGLCAENACPTTQAFISYMDRSGLGMLMSSGPSQILFQPNQVRGAVAARNDETVDQLVRNPRVKLSRKDIEAALEEGIKKGEDSSRSQIESRAQESSGAIVELLKADV
jgi:hypothetical protein